MSNETSESSGKQLEKMLALQNALLQRNITNMEKMYERRVDVMQQLLDLVKKEGMRLETRINKLEMKIAESEEHFMRIFDKFLLMHEFGFTHEDYEAFVSRRNKIDVVAHKHCCSLMHAYVKLFPWDQQTRFYAEFYQKVLDIESARLNRLKRSSENNETTNDTTSQVERLGRKGNNGEDME